ncbi:hypothetical protein AB0D34_09625 [Streptomyces sp. NPDC048420]
MTVPEDRSLLRTGTNSVPSAAAAPLSRSRRVFEDPLISLG